MFYVWFNADCITAVSVYNIAHFKRPAKAMLHSEVCLLPFNKKSVEIFLRTKNWMLYSCCFPISGCTTAGFQCIGKNAKYLLAEVIVHLKEALAEADDETHQRKPDKKEPVRRKEKKKGVGGGKEGRLIGVLTIFRPPCNSYRVQIFYAWKNR